MHGHTFGVQLTLRGPIHPVAGWVIDFADIDAAWAPIKQQLDHRVLNDVPGLDNPTSEHIAIWIWRNLRASLPQLVTIRISETGGYSVAYHGD